MSELSPEEINIIQHKATEPAFSGEYDNFHINGIYLCKQCSSVLYRSMDKFNSGCGWPSFDDEIPEAIKKLTDSDGRRTEILCQNCDGHLGHVFLGEQKTAKNIRHCVNSLSMKFISIEKLLEQDNTNNNFGKLILAGGCFWGIEYFYELEAGVLATACGYIGGETQHPTYKQVCSGKTNHAEAVAIIFDKNKTNETKLLDLFFDIHNPTEINKQGPDIGSQYRSAIFVINSNINTQKEIIENYINNFKKNNNSKIATQIENTEKFWLAEDSHQKYFSSRNQAPSCHYRRSNNT